MELLIARCAGLDVHQATVVATVRTPDDRGGRRRVTETFGTMTPDLLALREWLQAYGVTHVALESTGVYWKPVYYVLEDAFTLLLINMQDLKRVPGRKTDVRDSEWLAQWLECGLLKPSFVPPPAIRELRDLTRYRLQQVRDRSQEVDRLCKVSEDGIAYEGRSQNLPVPSVRQNHLEPEGEPGVAVAPGRSSEKSSSGGRVISISTTRLTRAAAAFQLGLGDARLLRVRRDRLPSGTRSSISGISLNSSNH